MFRRSGECIGGEKTDIFGLNLTSVSVSVKFGWIRKKKLRLLKLVRERIYEQMFLCVKN